MIKGEKDDKLLMVISDKGSNHYYCQFSGKDFYFSLEMFLAS